MNRERFEQVDRLLQSVLERPAAEREAFLDKACGDDASLKSEVRSLLASYDESGSFIKRPVVEDGARLIADEPDASLIGQIISNYKVIEPLGAGGMGEVYLALDTRTGRAVALKILLAYLTTDQERVRRFQQEARAVLALNHPNIVTIYEIGQAEGVNFIVTELIEGQTLRQRMSRQPLTVGESLDVAIQVAGALSYAHDKGVIHRDIKPENIMLRPDGYVKVLDFGIAKLTERRAALAATDPNEAQTRMKVETSPGMVMGTVHYMSPEQARGKEIDERTDTWSLGCVLYEMLTGQQPFEGETPSDVIATILKHDAAPLQSLLPDAPSELEHIVSKALDKSKDERYQTAKDFLADLRRFKRHQEREADMERSMPPGEGARAATRVSTAGQQASRTDTGEPATAAAADTARTTSSAEYIVTELKRHRKGVLIALAALVVVAVSGFGLYRLLNRGKAAQTADAAAPTRALKMTPLPVNGIVLDGFFSPDGKYLVYKQTDERGLEISVWLKHLPSDTVVQILPPTKDVVYGLIFSGDSNYVYYGLQSRETKLCSFNKISVIGGAPKKLIDNRPPASFSPSPDSRYVAILQDDPDKGVSNLLVMNEDGTGEHVLATRGGDMEWLAPSYAMWSSDSKLIACLAGSYAGGSHVSPLIVNVENGAQKEIDTVKLSGLGNPIAIWLPDGSGLLVSGNESTAPPSQIWYVSYPDGAAHKVTNDLNDYEVRSVTADLKAVMAVQKKTSEDVWMMPEGGDASQSKQMTFTVADEVSSSAAWTPDGKVVLLSTAGGKRSLWLSDADGGNRRQLVSSDAGNYGAAVSPDGRYIVFNSDRQGGTPHLWRVDMDGSNLKQLTFGGSEDQHPRVTPDGKWVIFNSWRTGKLTPWKVPAEGGEPLQLYDKPLIFQEVSPDGKLLACYDLYAQAGKPKVILLPVEGGEPVKALEPPDLSGNAISWTPDSRAITYISSSEGVQNIWAMPLDGGKPTQLTHFKSNPGGAGQSSISFYAISRDGKRIALTRSNLISSFVLLSDFK